MGFWRNITMAYRPKRPMLRRSTHHHCSFCHQNLREYRQETCDRCLLPLQDDKDMIVTMSEIRRFNLGFTKWILLWFKSNLFKIRYHLSWSCRFQESRGSN